MVETAAHAATRERREDIPLLIEHFARKYANRMNKSILSIPARTHGDAGAVGVAGEYPRLENFVGRSVILTPGLVCKCRSANCHAESKFDSEETETRRDKERQRILRALRACNGPLGGPNGAGGPRLQAHHASVQAEWFRNQSRRVARLT